MKEVVPIAPGKPGAVGRGACPGAACGVLGAGPTAPWRQTQFCSVPQCIVILRCD